MDLSSRAFRIISTIACVFSILFFFFIIGLWIYPSQVIAVATPIKVTTPVVKRGQEVKFYIHYIKHFNASEEISQSLDMEQSRDLTVCGHATINKDLPMGDKEATFSMLIPATCALGRAHIKLIFKYNLHGGMRVYTRSYETESFIVEK